MNEIICPECKQKTELTQNNETTVECLKCFEVFDRSDAPLVDVQNQTSEVLGLTLMYQKNRRTIKVPAEPKTILGRKSYGSEVFKEIIFNAQPVISRSHCSIEFQDNKFYLQDENSMNGTFYGLNKIDCRQSPQIIEDKSTIWLGEELFEVQILYRQSKEHQATSLSELPHDNRVVAVYRCNETYCDFESAIKLEECPKCETKNSLTEIYE